MQHANNHQIVAMKDFRLAPQLTLFDILKCKLCLYQTTFAQSRGDLVTPLNEQYW